MVEGVYIYILWVRMEKKEYNIINTSMLVYFSLRVIYYKETELDSGERHHTLLRWC